MFSSFSALCCGDEFPCFPQYDCPQAEPPLEPSKIIGAAFVERGYLPRFNENGTLPTDLTLANVIEKTYEATRNCKGFVFPSPVVWGTKGDDAEIEGEYQFGKSSQNDIVGADLSVTLYYKHSFWQARAFESLRRRSGLYDVFLFTPNAVIPIQGTHITFKDVKPITLEGDMKKLVKPGEFTLMYTRNVYEDGFVPFGRLDTEPLRLAPTFTIPSPALTALTNLVVAPAGNCVGGCAGYTTPYGATGRTIQFTTTETGCVSWLIAKCADAVWPAGFEPTINPNTGLVSIPDGLAPGYYEFTVVAQNDCCVSGQRCVGLTIDGTPGAVQRVANCTANGGEVTASMPIGNYAGQTMTACLEQLVNGVWTEVAGSCKPMGKVYIP